MSVDDALSVDVELDGADNRARAVVVERAYLDGDTGLDATGDRGGRILKRQNSRVRGRHGRGVS